MPPYDEKERDAQAHPALHGLMASLSMGADDVTGGQMARQKDMVPKGVVEKKDRTGKRLSGLYCHKCR